MAQAEAKEERWTTLDEFDEWTEMPMLALSVAWLAIVLAELIRGTSALLGFFGTAIWIVFIAEFAVRFALAPEKGRFLKRNWLIALTLIVPAFRLFRAFRALRAARALRGIRLVRIIGTANRSMLTIKKTLERRRFGYVLLATLLVTCLGAAGMLSFEPAAEVEGGFSSYGDALWWAGMLIVTMGSDFWPLTTEGRILCFLLSVYGIAVFGYIAASFASYFIGRDAEEAESPVLGPDDLAALREEIAGLRRELGR
ncbi:MAG: potassium channel family protein [Sphingomonadaceae bacterium]